MTKDILTYLHVMYRVRKVLQREHRAYQRSLFMKIGLPERLTEEEFDICIALLEEHQWLKVDKGDREAPILIFNEQFNNTILHAPEDVIANAMQSPPITQELLDGAR